ncbi:MAG: hypothetical protein ACLFV7_01175 [Phycisphaerae bacterium]
MTQRRRHHRLLWGIVWLGAAQFVVLAGLAMVFYPGGTEFDPTAGHYRFWTNTFSDLGRTRTQSGADNSLSAVLYHTALGILSLSLAAAWWMLPTVAPNHRRLKWFVRACGMLCVAGAVGVALTPADVSGIWHGVTIGIAAVPGMVGIVTLVAATWRDAGCPRWIALWGTTVLVSAGVHFTQYVHHFWLGGSWTKAAPTVQKIFASLAMGYLLAVSSRALGRRGARMQ